MFDICEDCIEFEPSLHQGSSSGAILRQINMCLGLYISCFIQSMSVEWTTNTGATKSKKVFEKIPEILANIKMVLTGVNGEPLKEFGKALFEVQLDQEKIQEEFVVA